MNNNVKAGMTAKGRFQDKTGWRRFGVALLAGAALLLGVNSASAAGQISTSIVPANGALTSLKAPATWLSSDVPTNDAVSKDLVRVLRAAGFTTFSPDILESTNGTGLTINQLFYAGTVAGANPFIQQ